MKIYRANLVFTPTPDAFRFIKGGYVCVEDNGIIEGVYETLPEGRYDVPVIDYGDRLLIPAFYDLHVHAPQYRNMGLALDLELLPWLEQYTFPEESKFADLDYAERIYRHFVHELWMQGSIRSSIFASAHVPATLLLEDLLREAGLGAYVGLVGMNRNCPDTLANTTEVVLDGLQQQLARQTDLVKPIVTPRFVPSCSEKMLTHLGQFAQAHNVPVQSHLSENHGEIAWVKELEPDTMSYGHAYNKYGLFGQTPTLMAHCCYTDGEELNLMVRQNVIAVHCPTSNCNVASGIAPVRTLLQAGVKVALGTDISAGHHMSILRVMQYALQMSKLVYAQSLGKTSFLTTSEAFYMATKSGGSFFGKCGSFEKGYVFDALLIDDSYLNYDHYDLPQRIERYIYLGDDRDIRRRFCNGIELCEPVML